MMKRTQIYLEEDLHREVRSMAVSEGRSAAALIREAVRRYLEGKGRAPREDSFMAVAGSVSGGPKDSAQNHDKYLYGPRRYAT